MTPPLLARWSELSARLGAEPAAAQATGTDLIARHSEPHRAYHALAHVAQCLAELDRVRAELSAPDRVELAIWFHDAVYATRGFSVLADNERKSAELATAACDAMGLSAELRDDVAAMVLATKTHSEPPHGDAAVFLDIDMSILATPSFVYDTYEANLRSEYAWVPEWLYRRKRRGFLTRLMARSSIFMSAGFIRDREPAARSNIRRALDALNEPVGAITVTFDETRVWTSWRGRLEQSITWDDLETVTVITTDQGPFVDDLYIALEGKGGAMCFVPSEAQGEQALVNRLVQLPGFRNEIFVRAVSSTRYGRFPCWDRPR